MNEHSTFFTVVLVASMLTGIYLDAGAPEASAPAATASAASEALPPGVSELFYDEKRKAPVEELPAGF